MDKSYYSNSIQNFLKDDENRILGNLTRNHEFALEDLQKNAWLAQIRILKDQLFKYPNAYIFFEYAIPRMGKRIDVALILNGGIFALEFKVGEKNYPRYALDQVMDYALDLKNFHEQSHVKPIIPILIATEAETVEPDIQKYEDDVYYPLKANKGSITTVLDSVTQNLSNNYIDPHLWENSIYKPTPTIIEAAQALYKGHNVREISRSDSDTINLSKTSAAISTIIDESKKHNRKSICFITGVPGAGKTLAGLNIANERLEIDENENAVFLSGNGPLVLVLQEALARNEVKDAEQNGKRLSKNSALSKTKAFIQNIHHFRDDALRNKSAPTEKVVVFDEAQRAWTVEKTASFMKRKKGISNFDMSEPEFLISVMDRHEDWATIICLIGGGQEINIGEAGLPEWFSAIKEKYPHWCVYVSNKLTDHEYTRGTDLFNQINSDQLSILNDLHLAVSVRSFRSEKVSEFVKTILDCKIDDAKELYKQIGNDYPIVLTRDISKAKQWIKNKARGTERYGLIASSRAYRLRPFGINIKAKIDPKNWFLNGKSDIRSSYFFEEVATEFDIQGLELDWTCVTWDADLRHCDLSWSYKTFRGTNWQNINDEIRRLYLKNTYRVLLTRARQGMVIFIPDGDNSDNTRKKENYDGTFNYLKDIGIKII